MSDPTSPAPADVLLVLVTVPDPAAGARLGRVLVEEQLAACVNVLPGLRSIYLWKGEIQDEQEALCLVKTRRSAYPALRARIEALHPYEVPEIIGLALDEGNAPYLSWVASMGGARPPG